MIIPIPFPIYVNNNQNKNINIKLGNADYEHKKTMLCKKDEEEFKNKHKKIIEQHTKKKISEVNVYDLMLLGFKSKHMTKKYVESYMGEKK
jgi:hypothetical protein